MRSGSGAPRLHRRNLDRHQHDPASHKFRIVYDITATTAGARAYFNPIRTGSIATDGRVTDRATSAALAFPEVDGETARAGGVTIAPPGSK